LDTCAVVLDGEADGVDRQADSGRRQLIDPDEPEEERQERQQEQAPVPILDEVDPDDDPRPAGLGGETPRGQGGPLEAVWRQLPDQESMLEDLAVERS
jgi:hypothetical protein